MTKANLSYRDVAPTRDVRELKGMAVKPDKTVTVRGMNRAVVKGGAVQKTFRA